MFKRQGASATWGKGMEGLLQTELETTSRGECRARLPV